MANLPASLRRTMLMLLVGMSMIVMVFYWNQSALKPMSYVSSIFQRVPRNKLVLDVWEATIAKYVRRLCPNSVQYPIRNAFILCYALCDWFFDGVDTPKLMRNTFIVPPKTTGPTAATAKNASGNTTSTEQLAVALLPNAFRSCRAP